MRNKERKKDIKRTKEKKKEKEIRRKKRETEKDERKREVGGGCWGGGYQRRTKNH